MSNELAELQREFRALWDGVYPGQTATEEHFVEWLKNKRIDARDDWRRLRRRIVQEGLKTDRQAKETAYLREKYARYFVHLGIAAADDKGRTMPWDDARERNTTKHPKDEDAARCPQPHCRRPVSATHTLLENLAAPLCGVCGCKLSARQIQREKSTHGVLVRCGQCKHDLCIDCGRGWDERACGTCERTVGLPPTDKLAATSTFSCWACGEGQEERRLYKRADQKAKGVQKDAFRCGGCETHICIGCGKPADYPFDPDYGFVRNLWYKFVDGYWDPPEQHSGFEKYLRRERRLGIPQFRVEDLYTPAHKIDVDNQDLSLYKNILWDQEEDAREVAARIKREREKNSSTYSLKLDERLYGMEDHKPQRGWRGTLVPDSPDYGLRTVDFGRQVPPPEGYDDLWYAENNKRVYEMTYGWAGKYFGQKDFPRTYDGKTWLAGLGEQFLQYANLVAHEDSFFGPLDGPFRHDGWEHILRDKENRKWLIVAIVAQIIEKKIFVELLFGATPEQRKELDEQDSKNLDHDGYRRGVARCSSINFMMGNKVVPDDFWKKIDELTSYTATILEPLYAITNLMTDRVQPAKVKQYGDARAGQNAYMYAELHYLLAHAGYLAVCMRRSTSVFHFLSATPGARMDYPTETQASYEQYRLSKEEAERLDEERTEREKAEYQALRLKTGVEPAELEALDQRHRLARHHRLRGAKVKFAVWPMITRYRAENVGKPARPRGRPPGVARDKWARPSDHNVESGEGQRVVEIGRCTVIYYQGVIYPRNDLPPMVFEYDGLPLLTYLALQAPQQTMRSWRDVGRLRFAARVLVAALLGAAYARRGWVRDHWRDLAHFVAALPAAYALFTALSNTRHVRGAVSKWGRTLAGLGLGLALPFIAYLWSNDLARLMTNVLRALLESVPRELTTEKFKFAALPLVAGLAAPQTRGLTSTVIYGLAFCWLLLWLYTSFLPYIVAQLDGFANEAAVRLGLPWANLASRHLVGKVVIG
ncbi:hypothetical protein KJ359_004643 [Pestalotiopsis sp. 9143b]|nr:hypothetical protein KJ359_004643 [Pestalotiopsis sp. 9143b]